MPTVKEILKRLTQEGELYAHLEDNRVRCTACAHCCVIPQGQEGICKVRFNESGRLRVPYGYVAGLNADPIEKKPFFHVQPGSLAMTFGMLGCDFHCSYCQNWISSQAIRDPRAIGNIVEISPERIMEMARRNRAKLVVSSYNEPLITSEWAVAIFKLAKAEGMTCGYVSNGNATPAVLDYLRPWADIFKIDLKGFNDRNYRKLGGRLKNILDSIRMAYDRGFWVEVVTLVVPGLNDSDDELKSIAEYIAEVSPDIPWHVTAYHRDYEFEGPEFTPAETLLRAVEIGRQAGLHFVYAGNLSGKTRGLENTYCPGCGALLVERVGFRVISNKIASAVCPDCGRKIPGLF